jgi:putative transcriptional regulator
VLLVLHHDTDGSLAVFINRPTWVTPSEALPALESTAYAGRVYLGGPVDPAQLLVLLRSPPSGNFQSTVVFDSVYLSTDPELITSPPFARATDANVRLYAGHAAWRRGQLDAEIAAGSWRVVEARAEDIFATDPLELWRRLTAPGGELVVDLPRATGR